MIISTKPERNETIDYFSYTFDTFDLHETWKNATRTKDVTENGRRLENACWRKFFQQKFHLRTISPSVLNWHKDSECCWLYGPFHPANSYLSIHDLQLHYQPPKLNHKRILKRKSDPAFMIQNLPPAVLSRTISNKNSVLPRVASGGISF